MLWRIKQERWYNQLIVMRNKATKFHVKALLFTSSEIFILMMITGRGFELIYLYIPEEPIVAALKELVHLPVEYHGFALLCGCFMHALAIHYNWWRIRAVALFGEMLFFCFSWVVLAIMGKPFLGMVVLPLITLFCFGNLINVVLWERVIRK